MLIGDTSRYLLEKTRAKAKMYEYKVLEELHIEIEENIPDLLLIAIGTIGNVTADISRNRNMEILAKSTTQDELEFSSKFFDAFLNSKVDKKSDYYYYLVGAVAYYLCGRIGSSQVLVRKIENEKLDLGCSGIEIMLANLLRDNYSIEGIRLEGNKYSVLFMKINQLFQEYNERKTVRDILRVNDLKEEIYSSGTPLELLLFDSFSAVFLMKLNNSALNLLPRYSLLKQVDWMEAILGGNLIGELWPSQIILGERGIYSGASAVIQMPTGTGKTKAISLIIYSSFKSERSNLAIVVAPFRALCREIVYDLEHDFEFDKTIKVNQLSDILQLDNFLFHKTSYNVKSILVLTPEKLLFVIRKRPELIKDIGLVIFDEGHLFDDNNRGATYELLVSMIKNSLRCGIQKILISAVISNASQLNEWMNDGEGEVITDNIIRSTEKQVAIADWKNSNGKRYGELYFLNPKDPEEQEFHIPQLINVKNIENLPRERTQRRFPDVKEDGKVKYNDIAIYCSLCLCENGPVAVFCGRKDSADKILTRLLELEQRGYDISDLRLSSNSCEINRLARLIKDNYGEKNIYYNAAIKGAFVHHGSVSDSLKLAVEYAIREKLISFIACTSTLAQGVNLPIRYLIVTSLYQGREQISVRDFHNLMGRVGRPGVYTEGTILLTETNVYNNRRTNDNWRWRSYKNILDEKKSEPCLSTLLELVKEHEISNNEKVNFYEITIQYYTNKEEYKRMEQLINGLTIKSGDKIRYLHKSILVTLNAIESFIMSYLSEEIEGDYKQVVIRMLEGTYGYYLATDCEKKRLHNLFEIIGDYIMNNTENARVRSMYSKSLLGIKDNKSTQEWLNDNIEKINICVNEVELLELIAPFIFINTENEKIRSIERLKCFSDIGELWINGDSYHTISTYCEKKDYMIKRRNSWKSINLFDVIEICDKGLGYSTTLLIAAISEIYACSDKANDSKVSLLNSLAKRLKYGLPNTYSIMIYEIGFSDRVIAQKIAKGINIPQSLKTKKMLRCYLKSNKKEMGEIISEYPQVFNDRINTF